MALAREDWEIFVIGKVGPTLFLEWTRVVLRSDILQYLGLGIVLSLGEIIAREIINK